MANPTIFASLRTPFIQDAAGFRAVPHTPWYWTGALLIPHPLDSANVPQTALTGGTASIGAVTEASLDPATGIPGQTAPTRLIQIGGTDGTDGRVLSTDDTGAVKLAAGTNSIGAVTEPTLDNTIGDPAAAAPAHAIQIGGTDGTDLRPLSTTPTGKLVLVTNVVQVANVSEAAATAFGAFTAPHTGTCRVLAASSVAATLSLTGAGQTNALGSLTAATWAQYAFPVVGGASYSFQVSAAGAVSLIANVSTD